MQINLETGEVASITDLYGDGVYQNVTDVNTKIQTANLKPHASSVLKIQVYPAPAQEEEVLFMQE